MSIASRQVKKELNKIIQERLEGGYVPSVEYIIDKLSTFYQRVSVGFPSFILRKQPYRKIWDPEIYNKNLSEIHDDLNNLYEELVDQFTVVLENFDYYDTERKRLMYEIKALEGSLNDLLLVAADTEGYMYSVHDDFIDRDNIDLAYTTCEINTDAGIVSLRESRQGIQKVDMSHYFDTVNFPILAEEKYAENIISNKLLAGSKFGYAFSDILTAWSQNIVSKVSGELEVSFIVELDPDDTVGTYISRIEMLGHSTGALLVDPLWSVDNINFKTLPMGTGERKKDVTDSKKTVWNFSEIRVRYIKFLIKKNQEDETVGTSDEPLYRYIYGFKHIEIFKMAYDKTSVFYSTAYTVTDPTGEALTIDKASITADHDVQPGTSIEYYLSLGIGGITDPSQFNWVAMSPTNYPDPKEQQVADFRHVAFFSSVPEIQWSESLYGTPLESYNEIGFYKVYEFPYEPVRDSVTLYRGKDNWQVTPRYEVKRVSIYNEEHAFGTGDSVTLTYPDFTPVEGDGLIRGSIVVKSEPGENPGYVYVNPSDYGINYSTKVITKTTGSTISNDSSAPSNTVYVDYEYDKEVSEPTLYTTYIYILNTDGLDINIVPFNSAEREAGQYLYMTTEDGTMDLSAETFFHIPAGWHKVTTTAEPQSSSDRFYDVNDNKYLYEKVYKQYAYADKLQEISWFELKYNTLKTDHSKYCIVDYDGDDNKEIIVNYKPQTDGWASSSDDLLCPGGAETYVLSYKYISTATSNIYFKAVFSREEGTSPLATPTLRGYTIKLGY